MASGYEGPHSPAKLRKMEADQHNPLFLAWLADMDRELKTLFTQDIPDMPTDPYTYEGLHHAEQAALRLFWGEPMSPDWADQRERLWRYIGQMFVRHTAGVWKYIDMNNGKGLVPVVQVPFEMSYYEPIDMLSVATSERTGNRLSYIYGWADKGHTAWVEHGRMPLREWLDFQRALRHARH